MNGTARFVLVAIAGSWALLAPPLGVTAAARAVYPYVTDFESASGWTLTGLWAVDGSPSNMPGAPSESEAFSLNYNNGSTYNTGGQTTGTATSATIDVSGLTARTLTFMCNYQTETAGAAKDKRFLRILDGSSALLAQHQIAGSGGSAAVGACPQMGLWHRHVLDLSPSWTQVKVQFLFDSVDGSNNAFAGWFIDDLYFDLPDLILAPNELSNYSIVDSGTTRQIKVAVGTGNSGTGPMIALNEELVFDNHHDHLHFPDMVHYRLKDSLGNWVTSNVSKSGFYLVHSYRLDPGAPAALTSDGRHLFGGWVDVYGQSLNPPVDVTGLPVGTYTLEFTIDPLNKIRESDETNNTAQVSIQLTPPLQQVSQIPLNDPNAVLQETAETGTTGWTAQAPWGRTSARANSPTQSWTDSPTGNYANNTNKAFTSPPVDLRNRATATLYFWQSYDLESNYDYGNVELSTDGGSSWFRLGSFTGVKASEKLSVSLNPYLGTSNLRVRFRLTSDSSVVRDGWYVDDIVIVAPLTATAPSPPSGLAASAVSTTEIRLTWTDASNNEDGFKIERSPDGMTFTLRAQVGPDATSYQDTGLAPSTRYYYRVYAYNVVGNSAPSNTANATTQAPPSIPAAPTGLSATAAPGPRIDLAWTDASSNETGFKIERSTDGTTFTSLTTVGANQTSYGNPNLSPATTYWYRVRATNSSGDSAPSNVASATTPANAAPLPPASPAGPLLVNAGATVAYDTSTTDPEGHRIQYVFSWGDGQNTTTGLYNSGATASASHAWSIPGNYEVTVRAVDEFGGASTATAPVEVRVQAVVSPNDTDGDGLSNQDESNLHGTDPSNVDSDNDGLMDGVEVLRGFNPLSPDQDANGVTDGQDDWDGDGTLNATDPSPGSAPGGGPIARGGGGGGGGCGLSGLEALALLGLIAFLRRR